MSSAVLRSLLPETPLTGDQAVRMPKVLLHDHLDGGLRPATVVELAAEYGYDDLPTTDVDELAAWLRRGANRRNLGLYLQTFAHTVGVMQHAGALSRVAQSVPSTWPRTAWCTRRSASHRSCTPRTACPWTRWSGPCWTGSGPVRRRPPRRAGRSWCGPSSPRCAPRPRSAEIAALALRFRDEGVVGFDIAGAEAGHPPAATWTPST